MRKWADDYKQLETDLAAAQESIEELEAKLESKNDHSRFLESLLEYVYGEGWETLTIHEAKKKKKYRKRITAIETTAQERERVLREHLKIIKRNIDAGAVNNFWIRDYINTALERKEG